MRSRGQDGAITVFLSIILLIMVTLTGVIVDVARINVAKPQIQRAVETSIRSTLAGYCTPLKEQYGLFALDEDENEKLKEVIQGYIRKNLMIDKEYFNEDKIGAYVDIYDYEIESIEVESMFNMTEDPVMMQQILEYMKYRAPKEFAQEFLDKLDMLKKAGSTSEAYKEKIDFEKELKGIENIQRELYKNIYGEYEERKFYLWHKQGTLDHFVRKLDEKQCSYLIDEYINAIKDYHNLKEQLKNAKEKESKDKNHLMEKIHKAEKQIEEKYNEMINEIGKYSDVNNITVVKINELVDKSKNARKKLNEYKTYLSENKDNILESSQKQLIQEVNEYEKQISYTQEGDGKNSLNEIKEALNKNILCLKDKEKDGADVISLIMKIDPQKAKNKIAYVEEIKEDILNRIKAYNNRIQYDYIIKNRDKDYKKFDTRKDSQVDAKEKTKINGIEKKQNEIVIGDMEYSILPSIVKLKLDEKDRDQESSFFGNPKNNTVVNDNLAQGIEFHEEEKSGFSESAFIFLRGVTQAIDTIDIRDEIYINEYIMGTFKNAVSDIDEEFNLSHVKKSDLNTYFDKGEVEYILNGSKSERINQTLMDSKILLTRFGLNSIHVFTCTDKKTVATSIATAVAGLYTGGAGIPILRTLILLGWAMSESIYDLDELKEGRDISLYKNEDNWKTDWKPSVGEESNHVMDTKEDEKIPLNEKGSIYTSYQDYLRFFLLAQDRGTTINRVQDLIQLNMQKTRDDSNLKLDGFNTYIRVEAVVSIKYLFLTQSFIPKEFKTRENRHKFKVIIYQGY